MLCLWPLPPAPFPLGEKFNFLALSILTISFPLLSGWRSSSLSSAIYSTKRSLVGGTVRFVGSGGVQCVNCMKNPGPQPVPCQVAPKLFLPPQNNQRLFGKSDEFLPGRPLESPSLMLDSRNDDIAIIAKSNHPFMHAQRARHFLTRPPRVAEGAAFDPMRDGFPHLRVARPPAEGRGRNQLLPRSNSTIVPLFEKVLSASDAGRIGRLVLPKACAEAYFPPISQPEGRPLTIQDAKGKEWHFQFRFWPNNNSRMYVLEGVTPCIQSLQLQAGDTVTFSRIEPGGKLVMGFRKATNTVSLPDSQISAIATGSLLGDSFFSNTNENLSIVSGYSGFLQSMKGAADLQPSSLFDHHANSADGDVSWLKADRFGGRPDEGSFQFLHKRSRNIGSKSRRLLMDNEEALELKLSWEEAQELLRPAPSAKPTIVMIEDYEFEEYDEPPVFAKRSIFTSRSTGEQDQWIQCDDCSKWRRVPLNVIIASKWRCADNTWDPKSCSCSAPEELAHKELQSILQQYEEIRRRKSNYFLKQSIPEMDASSLDALATAAVFGEVGNQGAASVATTTKHPRHRPGCTCIVCIQPPSGKGPKHNPACTCNVCMTVRRRFKTLMMRKKQRQSEREEAEASKRIAWVGRDEPEGSNLSRSPRTVDTTRDCDVIMFDKADANKGHIDLNFHPASREEEQQHGGQPRVSMVSLLEVANRPLESYMKQNGLGSDFINGHHRDACGENFKSSILSGPGLRVMKPHLRKSAQIDSVTGPVEMTVLTFLPRSTFQPNNILKNEPQEYSGAKLKPFQAISLETMTIRRRGGREADPLAGRSSVDP
uniref:B3 domain-containing protein n=1 Tax=Aegilops tauschii TaxID=37682 RepID=M8BVH1_AEGTA